MSEFRVAIVGAGPAGLTAAITARRCGLEVDVFEQAPRFARIGGAVGIQSNGLRVLDLLGLLPRADLVLQYEAMIESPPGRVVSRADFRPLNLPHAGFAVMLRCDLQELLVAALRELGTEVRHDERCTGVALADGAADLRFASGDVRRFDVVIACDGVRSAVRDALGFHVRRRAIGEAYLRLVSGRAAEPSKVGEFWGRDARRLGIFPLSRGRTYLFCSVPIGEWDSIRDHRLEAWISSWNDFGTHATALLEEVDWTGAVYDELTDLRVASWHRGAVFLIGDAAHAMTPNLGQGANSAMVDGVVLIRLLAAARKEPDALARVGARYEAIRRPFVTRLQNAALLGGWMASFRSPAARWMRDHAVRLSQGIESTRRASLRLLAGANRAEYELLSEPLGRVDAAPGKMA